MEKNQHDYRAAQREAEGHQRSGYCHPDAKPGTLIAFPSGSRYAISTNGQHWSAQARLNKAERKRFKRLKRQIRYQGE